MKTPQTSQVVKGPVLLSGTLDERNGLRDQEETETFKSTDCALSSYSHRTWVPTRDTPSFGSLVAHTDTLQSIHSYTLYTMDTMSYSV